MMAQTIEKAGVETDSLIKALRGAEFKTLLGDVVIRDFDGQGTFGYNTGMTYTDPKYPFKRPKDITRATGEEALHTKQEVEGSRRVPEEDQVRRWQVPQLPGS